VFLVSVWQKIYTLNSTVTHENENTYTVSQKKPDPYYVLK